MVAGKKLVCGCQGEEPAFDFKLGNCFDISVEGAIYHRSDLQLQLRRLSFGYKVFKKDFWGYLGIFLRIILNIVYRTAHCNIDTFILCRISFHLQKSTKKFFYSFYTVSNSQALACGSLELYNIRSFYIITLSVKRSNLLL